MKLIERVSLGKSASERQAFCNQRLSMLPESYPNLTQLALMVKKVQALIKGTAFEAKYYQVQYYNSYNACTSVPVRDVSQKNHISRTGL